MVDGGNKANIIVAPLNWGLGHATRCIPLIRFFEREGHRVFLAGSGISGLLLQRAFPHLPYRELSDYAIAYPTKLPFWLSMALQTPKVARAIKQESVQIASWAKECEANIVLSDHRYGVRVEGLINVMLCHQLELAVGRVVGQPAQNLHQKYLNRFSEVWVPDFEGENALAGKLSQALLQIPTQYLGPLSRFQNHEMAEVQKDIDYLFLLSGPESQRQILERKIIAQASAGDHKSVLLQGRPDFESKKMGQLEILPHANDASILSFLSRAKNIVCRSGYSSLMDLHQLGLSATLVPTPGQYEQVYLAQLAQETGRHTVLSQKDFKIIKAKTLPRQSAIPSIDFNPLLKGRLKEWGYF